MNTVLALLILLGSFAQVVRAEPVDEKEATYEASAELDLDRSWLDPAELIKVLGYDAKTQTYEISKVEDPTLVKIFTNIKNLTSAVPALNLNVLKDKPSSIVGRQYELEHELVLIEPAQAPGLSMTPSGR